MPTSELNTYVQKPASGGKPKQIIILLHGLGSNGQDLISLAPYWAKNLPDAVFVSPDAPFPCDMAPIGYQWFSLQSRDPDDMLVGIKEAMPILDAYLDSQLKKYGLTDDKMALVGFSQGTMMSLYMAPRRKNSCAGVLGYSGALLGEEELAKALHIKVPIHLLHGEHDDVVPIGAYHHAKNALDSLGFKVSGETYFGLPHSINEEGIESGSAFLEEILLQES